MKFNFILREMTHLRYYIPIIIEGNLRSIKSCFYIIKSNKYNCPFKHVEFLKEISQKYNIEISYNLPNKLYDFWFLNENSGLNFITPIEKCKKSKIIVTTYQTDFTVSYNSYKDHADYILMPSKNISSFYNLLSNKNVYFGITKYDTSFDKNKIIKKYNLNNQKKVLLVWPKNRDIDKYPIQIIKFLYDLNYEILVKSRKKDLISNSHMKILNQYNSKIFYDNWFPHTTQELIESCEFVINCGSTTIEECIMHNKPLINFDIKPSVRHGQKVKYRVTHEYLYQYNFCKNITSNIKDIDAKYFELIINDLLSNKENFEFDKCKNDWLYNHKNTCKNLLEFIL